MSKDFFNKLAPFYERLHDSGKRTFRNVDAAAQFKNSDIVLDIGGGTGRIAKFFVGKVKKIIVLDPAERMIEQCKKHEGVTCMIGDAAKLPFGDRSINRIILIDAFHHLPDQAGAILEMSRVLSKNGQIIIEEFNPSTLMGKLAALIERILKMGSRFYAPSDLAELFKNSDFKVSIIDEKRKDYYIVATK